MPNQETGSATANSRAQGMSGFVPVGSILDTISITKLRLKQLDAIQLVREQRENGKQELAYHARPFVLCGLPLRRPPAGRVGSSSSERQVLSGGRRPSTFWFALRPGSPDSDLGRDVGREAKEPYRSLSKSRPVTRVPATSEGRHSLPPSHPGLRAHLCGQHLLRHR